MSFESYAARIEAAVDKAENGSEILFQVANGDEFTEVSTTSGPVPSVKKWFLDNREQIADPRTNHAILEYSTYAEASAAAATLPDGQRIEIEADEQHEGLRTRNVSQGGAIVFVEYYFDAIGHLTSRMFGMVGVGDESAKAQHLLDAAAAEGKSAVFTTGSYHANSLVANCPVTMEVGAKIVYNGSDNGSALTIAASNTTFGDICVDGGGKNCTPVQINGDNNKIANIRVNNVVATPAGNFSFVGVGFYGDNNSVSRIEVDDFVNAGHSNDSFPQAVLSYGAGNTIDTIVCRNCRAGLVTSTVSGTTTVGSLKCYGMLDNGIYQLGGILILDDLVYHGTEEPAVFQGSGAVESITMVGDCIGLGFDNIGEFSVGSIHSIADSSGNTCKFLFRTRPLNTSAGRLSIGRISGTLKGTSLFAINQGAFEYLEVGSINVRFLYDPTMATSLTGWATLSACKGFDINDMHVEIIDINNAATASTIFQFQAPTAVSKRSFMRGLDATIYNADLTTVSPLAQFRGVNFAQSLIETSNVSWRTDIGPYLIARADNPMDSANAVPTSGTWVRGKRLVNAFPAPGGAEGWVCTTSGTPGVWKTFGSIAA